MLEGKVLHEKLSKTVKERRKSYEGEKMQKMQRKLSRSGAQE